MTDPTIVSNTPLTDYTVLTDEVTDEALGTGKVQYLKLMDGTIDASFKARVDASGAVYVSDQRVLTVLEEMLLASRNLLGEQIQAQPLSRSSDTVAAALATDAVMIDNRTASPEFEFANVAASQTDLLVSCPKGKRIRVLVFRLHTGGTATNVTFNSRPPGGTGVACSETFATAANGGHHGAFCPVGHFQTNADEDLSVTTGAGSTVGIGLVFVAL